MNEQDVWTASSPGAGLNKYTGETAKDDAYIAARVLSETGHAGNVHHMVDGRFVLVESIPAVKEGTCQHCHQYIRQLGGIWTDPDGAICCYLNKTGSGAYAEHEPQN